MASKKYKLPKQAGMFVSLFCLFLHSCGNDDVVVASVGDKELTQNEAYALMSYYEYDIKDDSVYRAFLNEWVNDQVYLQELKSSNPENYELIRLRSDAYAAELSRYEIEQACFQEQLDTVVTEEEIKTYYDQHKEEFILHDYIVKALYFKIPASIDFKAKKIQQKFLLKNDKDLKDVNSYAKLYAEDYYFNDSSWIFFAQLAEDIPLKKYNIDNIVLNRTKTYFTEDGHTYFLNIIDYKLKDEAPPLDFLRDQIREIIINVRLQELKEKNGNKLLKEIKNKHEIHINY